MKITALAENTSANDNLKAEHGLSLYIETKKHKMLVDTGSSALFLENAAQLGVVLSAVDVVVITHGHSDHGGGIKYFLAQNKTAKVYTQRSAFEPHYVKALGLLKINIGLDESLKNHPQIILVDGDLKIDNEIQLITNPSGKKLLPKFNSKLLKKDGKRFVRDDFDHEQSVVISENKTVLIGGCAHRGIINIIENAEAKTGKAVDYCISGFHLYNPASEATEEPSVIEELAAELNGKKIKYYTCHCTGQKAFQILKYRVADMSYLSAGNSVEI